MIDKLRCIFCGLLGLCLVFVAGLCLWERSSSFPVGKTTAVLAAAALTMPDGDYPVSYASKPTVAPDIPSPTAPTDSAFENSHIIAQEDVFSEDPSVYDDRVHLPVYEREYSEGDTEYDNFSLKNTTSYVPDISSLLSEPLGFDITEGDEVSVLIYHTHTSESYLTYDAGYYHQDFYPRSTDPQRNMLRVGEAVVQTLNSLGIGAVQATEIHDDPQYTGAYSRSRATIEEYMTLYPDIKVVLDIHRDSISFGDEGGKVKPTFTYNGKKAAQIMIMSGYPGENSEGFSHWQDNLAFALKLQSTAESMYPGMTRPLYLGNFTYNMDVCSGSLLIEVGTDVNTLSEAVYTGQLLANVLAKVLQS